VSLWIGNSPLNEIGLMQGIGNVVWTTFDDS